VAALASVQVTNNYALTGNGTMDVGANVLTNSGVISGAGRLTKAGAGTMVLSAANTYTGGTTINEGTVAISNGSAFGSYSFGSYRVTFASNGATVAALASVQVNNNWSLLGNGTMDVGANIILTNSGEIEGGPGRLTKSGAGTLILTAENYARTMTINEGTLQIGNGGTTGSLNWSLFPSMVNNASLIFNRSGSLTQMIAISGPGSLTKSGAGTLILSGTNTYTGGTTVNGGTLGLTGADTLADAGTVTVTGAGSVLTNSFSSDFNVGNSGSGGQLVVSNGGTVRTLGAAIGRNSTASNNKATVTGSNSLWINYYNLYVGSSGSGNSLVISNGGTVSDGGIATQVFIGANGSSSNNSVLVTGAGSLWTNRGELYVGGSGSGNSLVISNGGTVAFSSGYIGSTPNNSALVTGAGSLWTNSSTLTVRGGTLTVSDGGTLAASAISIAANAGSSGTLNIGRFGTNDTAGTINAPTIVFGGGTGAINFNQSDATTISFAISGNGAVKQLGAGTTVLTGSNSYTGGTLISTGTLALGSANRLADAGAVTVNGGTLDLGGFSETVGAVTLTSGSIGNGSLIGSSYDLHSGNVSALLAGNGALTKTGTGTVTLTCDNIYSGTTTIRGGALQVGNGGTSGTLGSGAVSNNASLIVKRSDAVNLSNVISGTGGFTQAGTGTTFLEGNNSYTGGTLISAGTLALGSANRLADTGAIMVNGGVFDLGGFSETVGIVTITSGTITNGTLTGSSYAMQSGSVSASLEGDGDLTKTGTGTVTLTGDNSYSGTTTISGGVLQVGNGGTSGTLGRFAVINNASLIVNRSDAVSIANIISGTGSFTMAGSGTTILTGSNTYTGTTTISAGTLLANNTARSALGSSTVTVQSGGTLGGNGSIAGPVTIASGGKLTPGSGGAGALSLSNGLTLQSGATTTFLINSAASFTSINILGNSIAYGGDLEFNILNYTPADGNIFTLFNMTGGATTSGAFSNVRAGGLNFVGNNGVWTASSGSHAYEFSQATGQLSVTVVPEPSTYALLALGALALIVACRRSKRGA
jgi:fibronectin-binding autotransporter adhesin